MSSAIDAYLARVRRGISIVDPSQAAVLREEGALLVDTRSVAQRQQFGEIPGALIVDRNVLEWRLDPTSEHRHPRLAGHEGAIIVLCQQGYSSSLAVATLCELGLQDVHDLGGGFEAWAAAGLPVQRPGTAPTD